MKVLGIIFLYLINTCSAYINMNEDKIVYTIALKQNNVDILENALLDISDYKSENYGNFWTKDEILNKIKPTDEDTNKVTDWLEKYNTEYYNYGDALQCKNKVEDVEKMFNIRFVRISGNLLVSGNYIIPENLKNIIEFIEGLSNNNYGRTRIHPNTIQNSIEPDPGYAAREVINKLYNITWNRIKSNNTSICAIEYQGQSGFNESDLLLSQKENLENLKSVKKNQIIGNDGYEDIESQLDMQMMSQVAENVDLWFWDSPQWLYTFSVDFFNKTNIPDVISMSWGWAESDQCAITQCNNETARQYINRVNVEYMKFGLRGVTIAVASGDAGAPGRTNEDCSVDNPVNPVFPGSSPWVTSVGATFVLQSNNTNKWKSPLCKNYGCINGNIEMNTNNEYVGWTAGGGFGIFSSEKRPKWQNKTVNKYLKSHVPLPSNFSRTGRAYPDVSAIGHNCPVFNSGSIMDVDGTSCSSPIFAGIIALLNDYQKTNGKKRLGFVNPVLYEMAKDGVFHDWTVGNNWCTEYSCCPVRKDNGSDYGYMAAEGWDPVYGLGTPNVGKMIHWLSVNT